ncbi:hypothetical protein OPV22_007295 [Ensete ventricosum]|uniref:Uncharacterized protein n=1 Tax=Ensete ventricosum TaxID=4639 RepID=A0AAV8RPZ1_ENSVE|nr:hypothetical protein OPV22_007295 [Ensete ventricosum]
MDGQIVGSEISLQEPKLKIFTDAIDCCPFSVSLDSASVDGVARLRFGRFSMPSSVSSLLLNHLSINPVHEDIYFLAWFLLVVVVVAAANPFRWWVMADCRLSLD